MHQKIAIVSDTHGDMINRKAEAAFFAWLDDFNPDVRIHAGDFMDLRSLRQGASAEERAEGIKEDVEAGLGFLRRYAPNVVLLGNHDHRLWREAMYSRIAQRRELFGLLLGQVSDVLDEIGCKVIPYGKRHWHDIGDLRVIHGTRSGMYAARQSAQDYGKNVLMGHIHAASFGHAGLCWGQSIGCLCKLDMEYNRNQAGTLRQHHGWAMAIKPRRGSVGVTPVNLPREGKTAVVPTGYREVACG